MGGRKAWVGGNWKCNGTKASIDELCQALNKADFSGDQVDIVICPVALHLTLVKEKLRDGFKIAAQNCSATGFGAFTGELAIEQLLDIGINWTLIGHSERRQYYGEDDAVVAKKVAAAQEKGISVAVCIGETLDQREAGETTKVVTRQIEAVVPSIKDWSKVVIAYEPVWAIGTGKVATPEQAQETHADIRKVLREKVSAQVADECRIVYGGSVSEKNCDSLIGLEDVDGFLVGGASLKPAFNDIIKSATRK